ncbi:SGNH/GDSL hydrolase family protein [Leucobacter sp. CSA2]|uniref:SGNH/GDSL hydrolase family protein n=1 Tax=Leucobacter edaphi TaxID=2796472 RepID=A0A934QC55_9MICO|nr:SGNH/GDSL hydrolase family protein [Leucobacter edaphi]MBK0421935.1 SGNH/GDSL hydrolase family protein [Leucobacter edaphi]
MSAQLPGDEIRYVAIGDSFTEGVGDDLPDGGVRGWADLVAEGLAEVSGKPVRYANLAIRGRLLGPIIAEQLLPALDLSPAPTLVSFNGGGNDMLRPGTDIPWISAETEGAMRRILEAGSEPLLLAGANPTAGLPGGGRVKAKGDELVVAARGIADRLGIRFVDNWSDPELAHRQYWSNDRLHLAPIGHRRVAANVLRGLGYEPPAHWVLSAEPIPRPGRREQMRYTREHVLPWIQRRLTGRSSGDGRSAKFPDWVRVEPASGGRPGADFGR